MANLNTRRKRRALANEQSAKRVAKRKAAAEAAKVKA